MPLTQHSIAYKCFLPEGNYRLPFRGTVEPPITRFEPFCKLEEACLCPMSILYKFWSHEKATLYCTGIPALVADLAEGAFRACQENNDGGCGKLTIFYLFNTAELHF
jgi:hypothetical protein